MKRVGTGLVLLVVLAGCGTGPVAGDEVGDTDSETSAGTDSSSEDGETTDTESGTETGTETGTEETTGDGDTETDTGPLECPPPEPVTARFTVTPSVPMMATCAVIEEVSDGANLYEMMLDCEGTDVTIGIDSTILIKPYPGEMVQIDYRVEAIGPNEDRWLAVHRFEFQDALVLGGVAASRLDPPGTTLGEFFHDPALTVAAQELCDPTTDSCGELRRLALDVTTQLFGLMDPVFDHGSWFNDFLAFGYVIEVETATRRVAPVGCDDVPDEWFELLAVWFPSD